MMQFIIDNKEILTLGMSLLGILLTLAFTVILSWRHKICFDYESRASVAVNILRDQYVQQESAHYSEVAKERKKEKTGVEEIYRRPEHRDRRRKLAKNLEDQNRVNRLYRFLLWASNVVFWFVWVAILLVLIGMGAIWVSPPSVVTVIWIVGLGLLAIGFVVFVSAMHFFAGRFFKLVHRITESEGE